MTLWYEVNEPKTPLIRMYCPVCKHESLLGKRERNHLFFEHCNDCKAVYTWQPNEDTPSVLLDSDIRHKHCGCDRCKQ
jgi:uncharacterized protein YbaR (Trm112 family)